MHAKGNLYTFTYILMGVTTQGHFYFHLPPQNTDNDELIRTCREYLIENEMCNPEWGFITLYAAYFALTESGTVYDNVRILDDEYGAETAYKNVIETLTDQYRYVEFDTSNGMKLMLPTIRDWEPSIVYKD